MSFPLPRFITHDGFQIALYEAGPLDGYPLILVHGWPEMAYSWKNQIEPLANAGYRVCALDLRGFGASSAPRGLEHYGISQIVSDIEAILDDLGAKQAALIGHDWGGIIVWHGARMLGRRIGHVIGLCTPHIPRPPVDPIKIFRKRYGAEHYFVHFHDRPGEAEGLFARDPNSFFRMMFKPVVAGAKATTEIFQVPARFKDYLAHGNQNGETVMSEEDLKIYSRAFARSGFHGGLNLYRNTSANWALAEGLSGNISQPSLMISGERDLFLPPASAAGMEKLVPDLERHIIDGCGHWMMWEKPEAVNALMLDWLGRRTN